MSGKVDTELAQAAQQLTVSTKVLPLLFLALGSISTLATVWVFAAGDSGYSVGILGKLSVAGALCLLGTLALYLFQLNRTLSRSIAESRQQDLRLKKLGKAVTKSGCAIAILDSRGRVEYINQQFEQTTGYSMQEIIENGMQILHPKIFVGGQLKLINRTEWLKDAWTSEVHLTRKDSAVVWASVSVSVVDNNELPLAAEAERDSSCVGKAQGYVVSAIDISELKNLNHEMERLALNDDLTGLANRRLFVDRLEMQLRVSRREKNSIALLFLDLDKFKRINDTLGHDAGDQLLITVAERLKRCVRANDTVARFGGDEFVVLLTDITDPLSVTHIAQLILASLKQPITLNQHEIIVSTSIGITLAPTDGLEAESLVKNADLALYRAKDQGRDCYHYFTEELNAQAIRQLVLEQELRLALNTNQFSLAFQPQFDFKQGRLISVEALLRWNHPTHGTVFPNDFVTVAEETGLIVPIGDWVLRNACKQIRQLQVVSGRNIKVAVNLSMRQFHDEHLEDTIAQALHYSGLKAKYLELEVTESMLMGDVEMVVARLTRLKSTGVSIAIDDFGSGYSSLSYLRKLPVDVLKVDRAFVRDIPEQLHDMEITAAVIAVAHKLGLKVVAEGVENIDQRDFLMINRCDYAQGYFFSKPLSYTGLNEFMQRNECRQKFELSLYPPEDTVGQAGSENWLSTLPTNTTSH
ncbi:putative bifunctional diguanylate cyclase/phosphodiesterase [Allohahella sp. A8]|uniref:putative bifunctional diguanylate cyclase/phosphodiesterase n=1 Tax=Allohahella sp. A8 TaxID=3141461 RepID=UPI0026B8A9B8